MSLERKVTLEDFIMPEYRGKNPDDYEFRGDGKIVRKDRWETGIHRIHTLLVDVEIMPDSPGEIGEVVKTVELLIEHCKSMEASNQFLKKLTQ